MTERAQPTDLELAALISSKICHDVINPVGAIYNGLEILDEDDDAEAKTYALDVIRNVTEQASARLQFARFAFGAAGSAGAQIELATAEQISRGLMAQGKHKLVWRGIPGQMAKDKVKLLLNLVASAVTALPRGGEIEVAISRQPGASRASCCAAKARPRARRSTSADYVGGGQPPQLDAMSIQAYYTWRLAAASKMRLDIAKDGADVLLTAKPTGLSGSSSHPVRPRKATLTLCVQARRPSADGCQPTRQWAFGPCTRGANLEASMKTCLVVDDSEVVRKVARRIFENLSLEAMRGRERAGRRSSCCAKAHARRHPARLPYPAAWPPSSSSPRSEARPAATSRGHLLRHREQFERDLPRAVGRRRRLRPEALRPRVAARQACRQRRALSPAATRALHEIRLESMGFPGLA